jgi:poly(3-hydroxybutyrate) depolymerase
MHVLRVPLFTTALVAVIAAIGLTVTGGTGLVSQPTVVSSQAAPTDAAGTSTLVEMPFRGVNRSYRLFVPTDLPAGPRPLLVGLHSLRSSAAYFERTRNLDVEAGRTGVLIAYPNGYSHSWDAGTCCGDAAAQGADDVGFVAAVIADVESRFSVDRHRLALVGSSNGAMMSYRFACERSDLVNVVVAMVGTDVAPRCTFSRPVSLLHVHGGADLTVPFAGVPVSHLDAAGFPPVRSGVRRVAGLDGCSGTFRSVPYAGRPDVSAEIARGCPPHVKVELVVSRTMGHDWITGPELTQQYGVDMTAMTWRFVEAAWAGHPIALTG